MVTDEVSETAQMGTTGHRHTVCLCSLYTCGNSFQVNKTSGFGRRKVHTHVEAFSVLKGCTRSSAADVASDLPGSTGEFSEAHRK